MTRETRHMKTALPTAVEIERLLAAARRTPSTTDSLIAATALQHDLRLVTRNVADFDFAGLKVVNPWGTRG